MDADSPGSRSLRIAETLRMLGAVSLLTTNSVLCAQPSVSQTAKSDVLAIDSDNDPLLRIERETTSRAEFENILHRMIESSPAIAEAEARNLEALAGRNIAWAGRLPAGELAISNFRTLSRAFSNDPQNIIERSRPRQRTDATISLTQPLFDFGASANRVAAAQDRITTSEARFASTAEDVVLRAIAAWYELFAMRTLVALGNALDDSQKTLGHAIDRRIDKGVSSRSDRVRVDGTIAAAQARLAGYRRGQASAEARFAELLGPAPAKLLRAPAASWVALPQGEQLEQTVDSASAVRAARADADAARRDAKAVHADLFPTIAASVDAGRYGVLENDIDYDVRARLTVRLRLFGGGDALADQAAARAMADTARADRIREEALREASIAASDVTALEDQLVALRGSYISAKISRDVLAERFRVARGTLFDLLSAEDAFFSTASAYVQGIVDLDIARYVLLARTGQLLPALGVDTQPPTNRNTIK